MGLRVGVQHPLIDTSSPTIIYVRFVHLIQLRWTLWGLAQPSYQGRFPARSLQNPSDGRESLNHGPFAGSPVSNRPSFRELPMLCSPLKRLFSPYEEAPSGRKYFSARCATYLEYCSRLNRTKAHSETRVTSVMVASLNPKP